jgi:hypothetical protein
LLSYSPTAPIFGLSQLGVDEFVVSAEDTSDVMMANLPASKSLKTPLEIARAEIIVRQTAKLKELQRQREAERNAYLLPGETAASRPSDSRSGLGSAGGGGSRPFTRDGVFARPSALWLRPGSSMAAADGDRYQIRPGTREAGRPNTQVRCRWSAG